MQKVIEEQETEVSVPLPPLRRQPMTTPERKYPAVLIYRLAEACHRTGDGIDGLVLAVLYLGRSRHDGDEVPAELDVPHPASIIPLRPGPPSSPMSACSAPSHRSAGWPDFSIQQRGTLCSLVRTKCQCTSEPWHTFDEGLRDMMEAVMAELSAN